MGSNGGDKVVVPMSNETESSEAMVEIKIKTLDSQTYTLRVDKYVPVPALKEQIATVTGVLTDQQRLICRGKVLKDDQLLSAYHVEDGHTLHLVVRQPIPPLSEGSPDDTGTEPGSSAARSQGNHRGPSVVVGTFSMSEQGDGALPDLSQIVSAVLGSFGISNMRSGNEGVDLRDAASTLHPRTTGLGVFTDASRQRTDHANVRGPSNNASPLGPPQPPVIPDSLTTLSQYLSHMRHEFSASVNGDNGSSQRTGAARNDLQASRASLAAAGQGLPTPEALGEVIQSTRQLLIDQAAECMLGLATLLENQANITDSSERLNIQSTAMRSGVLLRDLGALLLELSRTIMTLRMGQTPAEAVVNAGPAVFVSTSGPNPIMVQPFPFQPGTSLGTIPMGTVQPGAGLSDGTSGSTLLPRTVDIRIRTGSLIPTAIVNQGEQTGIQQPPGQTNTAASGVANPVNQDANHSSGNSSSTREAEVRVVPIRTVVAAVPAHARNSHPELTRGSMGLLYPVMARVQHVTSGNLDSARGSSTPGSGIDLWQPELGLDQTIGYSQPGAGTPNNQEYATSTLDEFLRTVLPDRYPPPDLGANPLVPASNSSQHGTETNSSANAQETSTTISDEGTFLSNVLRQVMPIISQSNDLGSNMASSSDGTNVLANSNRQASSSQETSNDGTTSHRRADEPSSSNSKRQKRE